MTIARAAQILFQAMRTAAEFDAAVDEMADAPTGSVFHVLVDEAGPQATQAASIDIVVLGPSNGLNTDAAYRYSTQSQDENWQVGTLGDAFNYADEVIAEIENAAANHAIMAGIAEYEGGYDV